MRLYIFCIAFALTGCAGTTVHPVSVTLDRVKDAAADKAVNGFRYYEGAYSLIVYTDGKGGLQSEVKFLPDLTQKRSIDPWAWFAKNETTLTFSNGMLTESKAVIDETVLPKSAIGTLEKIATAAIAAGNLAEGRPATYMPAPVLFKIQVDSDTGKLKLLRGNTVLDPPNQQGIEVTLGNVDK